LPLKYCSHAVLHKPKDLHFIHANNQFKLQFYSSVIEIIKKNQSNSVL